MKQTFLKLQCRKCIKIKTPLPHTIYSIFAHQWIVERLKLCNLSTFHRISIVLCPIVDPQIHRIEKGFQCGLIGSCEKFSCYRVRTPPTAQQVAENRFSKFKNARDIGELDYNVRKCVQKIEN